MKKEELIENWISSELIKDDNLLNAFKKIKRENFVLSKDKKIAYEDIALSIKYESTISQPTTIMIMLQALDLKPKQKVLEVGAGSGYTAALIKTIIGKEGRIYSTDVVKELIEFAKKNFKKEKITGVNLICQDGSKGLKEKGPFDRILVNAACRSLPKELIDQLKINGIIVAPIDQDYSQKMVKITKLKDKLKEEYLGDFLFVRLK